MAILPERTERFEAFVAPATAWPALWRLLAGAVLAAAVWLAVTAILLTLAIRLPGEPEGFILVAYLWSFAGLILGTAAAARVLQRRRLASLLGPGGFRPRDFALGMAAVVLLGALSGLAIAGLAPPVRQLSWAAWAAWLPIVLPAILVQTAAEELAFRGYLMQGLAARFRSRWIWLLLPAALFGALHWNPAEFGPNAWIVAVSTGLIGLVLADITVRTGNLSAAIGIHFANNVASLLVVALPSPLGSLSLYLARIDSSDAAAVRPLLLADLATTVAAYAAWLALCHRHRRLHSQGRGSI